MVDSTAARQGVLEGSARVLRAWLHTARTRRSLAVLLDNLDPDSAALVVDALTEDPGLSMDLAVSMPALGNACVAASHQLLRRLEIVPAALLKTLVPRMLADVQAQRLGEVLGLALASMLRALDNPEGRDALSRFGRGTCEGFRHALGESDLDPALLSRRALRWGIEQSSTLALQLHQVVEEDPEAVRRAAEPLLRVWREVTELVGDEPEAHHG